MVRSSIHSGSGSIWLPSFRDKLFWKIIITKPDGTQHDVSDYFKDCVVNWPSTDNMANVRINLDNGGGRYVGVFGGGDKLEIWADYDATGPATSKIYRGKVDNVFYGFSEGGYVVTVESLQCPEARDVLVVEQYDGMTADEVIKDLIGKYLSGVLTYNNISYSSTPIYVSFRHVSVWKAISEVLKRAEQDGYIDTDMDLHTFDEETVLDTTDTITAGYNLLSVDGYGKNNNEIKNKVFVYGNDDNNMPLIKVEEDTDSQSELWEKTFVVNDNSVTTMDMVQDKADYELEQKTTKISPSGDFTIIGSPGLVPGKKIRVSAPYCNINGQHRMMSVNHSLSTSGFTTTVELRRHGLNLGKMFKERIESEERLRSFNNLNHMENSYRVLFDEGDEPWTLSSCEVIDGVLKLSGSNTQGECLFDTLTADNDIISCELRINSNWPNTENDVYQVSNNGGFSWMIIEPGKVYSFSGTGKLLKFKIQLNKDSDHNPAYEGVCVMYK